MKRIFLLSIALFSVVAFAATPITLDSVNKTFETILAPYQNTATKAKILLTDLEVKTDRIGLVKGSGHLNIAGQHNVLDLKVLDVTFDGNKKDPVIGGSLEVDLDLVTALGHEMINELGEEIDALAVEIASDFVAEYGAAAEVVANIPKKSVDKDGNLTHAELELNLKVDLSKLPQDVPIDSIEVLEAEIKVSIGLDHIDASFYALANGQHKAFKDDAKFIKEELQKLVDMDPAVVSSIEEMADFVISIGTKLANEKSN